MPTLPCLVLLLLLNSFADEVATHTLSRARIAYSTEPAPDADGFAGHVTTMREQGGLEYRCFVPAATSSTATTAPNITALSTTGSTETQRYLSGQCMVKREGWWAYEYCHERYLRQYHLDELTMTVQEEHFLGFHRGTIPQQYNVDTASGVHLTAMYTEGSACDITGKPRVSVIRYRCVEEIADRELGAVPQTIAAAVPIVPTGTTASHVTVVETDLCRYEVTLHVPLLCAFTLQRSVEEPPTTTCYATG